MASNLGSKLRPAVFCDHCRTIDTPDGLSDLFSEDGYRLRSRSLLYHEYTSGGCVFCTHLMTMSESRLSTPFSLRMRLERGNNSLKEDAQTLDEFIGTDKIHDLGVTFESRSGRDGGETRYHVTYLDAFTLEDDSCLPFVSKSFSFEGISSDKTLGRLLSYWKECERSHPECRNVYGARFPKLPQHILLPSLPKLPTRVLDVATVEGCSEVKLYITKDNEQSRYIALSYCWGGPQHLTTTTKSRPERVNGIPLSFLPKTILDAIRVMQQLGLRYLWVDSLCILQDSPDDKRTEIALMGELYKNATITIAAGSAKEVEEGFLSDRPLFDGCPLPFRLSNQSFGNIYFRVASQPLASDPILFSRGWTFQEFLLSPRVILYDRFGVTWNCSATSFKGLSDVVSYKPSHKLNFSRSIQYLRRNIATSIKTLNSGWSNLVSEYSARDFTYFEDRLPALAGIAKEFSSLLNDEYVTGFWREELIWTPGWQKNQMLAFDASRPFRHLRQKRIGSPSWSWKTAPFPIIMPWWRGSLYALKAEVIDCKVKLASEDSPFGDVTEGILSLRAKVTTVSAIYQDNIRLDYSTDKLDSSVYILLLGIWNKEGDPEGLVVRKLGDENFERIGFFRDRSGRARSWDSVVSQIVILR